MPRIERLLPLLAVLLLNLGLAGAAEAVASMLDCQAAMASAKTAKRSGNDPFAPKPDPI